MKRYFILAALVVLAGVWAWTRFGGDRDARRIHARFDALVSAVEKTGPANQLRMLAVAQQIPEYFTAEATISLAPLYGGTLTRREVASYVVRIHQALDRLTIRIGERRLDIDRENNTATLRLTAQGFLEMGSETESHTHAFEISWRKIEGEWYIQQAATLQSIRRPGT